MRTLLLAIVLCGAVAVPARADFIDEINAADEVERILDHRHPGYDALASCRQVSRRRFTCKYSGFNDRGDCSETGRAAVLKVTGRHYRARILSRHVSCF